MVAAKEQRGLRLLIENMLSHEQVKAFGWQIKSQPNSMVELLKHSG